MQRRGYHAINGDIEWAYSGDPATDTATRRLLSSPREQHEHHIWNVDRVKALVADQDARATFFCGGSRNYSKSIHLFNRVVILEIDVETLKRRLDQRPQDDWGGTVEERDVTLGSHRTKDDIPNRGIVIDSAGPLTGVVDEILRRCEEQ